MIKVTSKVQTNIPSISAILIAIIFQSCGPTQSHGTKELEKYEWAVVKENKNPTQHWAISKRKIKNSTFWEYKIEGTMNSTPKEGAIGFREDIHNLAKGSNPKEYPIYKIIKESKDSLVAYFVHNESFFFKDTEMCVKFDFHNNENGDVIIEWTESWNDCSTQPNKRLKRVETFRGNIHLSSAANNTSKIVQTVQFDPKGMPMWLVNPMVVKFLKKELIKFKSLSDSGNDNIY